MVTIRDVAKAAGVSVATVSAVVNDSAYVSPELRGRVVKAIGDFHYTPSQVARNLSRGRTQLIALAVADLANPFYARVVWAAEAAAAAWGYALVVFNSDENPDTENRVLDRIRALACDGTILVPVAAAEDYRPGQLRRSTPVVLLGRSVEDPAIDTVTIDNRSAGRQATAYLTDLGHTRIGSITGPLHLSTGKGRFEGMVEAMAARGLAPLPGHIRSGEFREEVAYSVARDLLRESGRPTALYVANGLMALGVMRAIADLSLRCPADVSVASTDNIAGIGGLRPQLTRTEHPVAEMTNEALRMLIDRIKGTAPETGRNVVYNPNLVVGDSCAPLRS
jgi:LacI family transcriptional regulator